ncbi:MAG: extracellular solute-binding protein [Phycisphaerales bacterium]|nr:extracellular solute-binding protein [Phycisphaerales bacterium]
MKLAHIILASCLVIILGVPFLLSMGGGRGTHTDDAPTLVVFTPHVPQIRDEFARAFSDWHLREFGERANLDFRTPGGTSEIRKQLEAMYTAALDDLFRSGNYSFDPENHFALPTGTIAGDVMLGGGSFDHGMLKTGIRYSYKSDENTTINITLPLSTPASFTQDELDALFGENRVGPQELYDPDQYWIGTALSSFGIVYNNDVLHKLGLETPDAFEDLTDPRLWGWIALADPRQSGSVTTTFDSILGNEGWDKGWRTLRGMCGNTRYFTNSSTKPPIDVSQGEAAAGLAIDFYGRGQAQVIKDSGGGDRVGYSDPAGAVYVDADPVSILNGGANPELAMRFVRFCLTEEAQALWQFPAWGKPNEKQIPENPLISGTDEEMGPEWYELRRMPVRRVMYDKYFDLFIDKVDPFTLASDVKNPGWRTGVQVMMGCFGIDIADDCREAYKALSFARGSDKFTETELAELDALYYAFPETRIEALASLPGFAELSGDSVALVTERGWKWQGEVVAAFRNAKAAESAGVLDLWNLAQVEHYEPFTEATFRTVRNEWRQLRRQAVLEIEYARFYQRNDRELIRRVNQKR